MIDLCKTLLFVTFRVLKYKFLSDCNKRIGKPKVFHPLLLKGKGTISFGKNVQIGVIASPFFYSHYSYIEARNENSQVFIGNNVSINNSFSAVAFSKIVIKNDVLIGFNCSILDNDAHDLSPINRKNHSTKTADVLIEDNVFIGNNVTILKGVTIGKNSVIGNGSIVTKNIPENVVAAGNPAQVIRNL
jgi:galactoside O-acetyltransferase